MGWIIGALEKEGLLKMEISSDWKMVDFIDVCDEEIIYSINKKQLKFFRKELELLYYEMKD